MSLAAVHRRMKALGNPADARFLQGFFKTGPGQYGAGDRFLGIRVPMVRQIARECDAMTLTQITALLKSPWHEERLLALVVLVRQYERGDAARREAIYRTYMANTARINNWDLVDASAPYIVGPQLKGRARAPLERLARSPMVWERRIAILATFHYISGGEFTEALAVARLVLDDSHDLIHKAMGWMLREVGKRDRAVEEAFLRRHLHRLPRTTLRYAIERFPRGLKARYLSGTVGGSRRRSKAARERAS